MQEKSQKISVPLKKIQALVKIAKDNDLELLELGPLRIVTRRQSVQAGQTLFDQQYQKMKEAPGNEELTAEQAENIILFGTKDLS